TNGYFSESFYVAGMLHDIGSLVIYNKSPIKAQEALARSRNENENLFKSESKIFGFDHADVGGALLDAWKLPRPLVEAVSYHHYPSAATTDKKLTAVVHLADVMAYEMQYMGSGESFVPTIDPEAMKELGILKTYLNGIMENIGDTIDDTISMFL
ncbi:MAG: HDOD domain-containing protein, partial [Nitrospinae bacterium]|nr:HDOD domain-containing protein [Nitrospinota bacterium]